MFFLSIVLLCSHKFSWSAGIGWFTLLSVLCLGAAYVFYAGIERLFGNDEDSAGGSRIVFSLLVLAWGPFMAFHLYDIPQLNAISIRAEEESLWGPVLNYMPINLLFVLQLSGIVFAALCSGICLWRIRVRQEDCEIKRDFWRWKLIAAVFVIYLISSIVLILPGGVLL